MAHVYFAVAGGSLKNNYVPNISIDINVNEALELSEALVLLYTTNYGQGSYLLSSELRGL